ncbi:AAA family ATPase [Actinomadura formosensis]|uniref:AAA family ATPase n=1 Tax=Actinomadura formosensis TaxID=60706 RepID=UPI000AFF00E7|nr:LuxR family transcriptional regulator [Actinomadura formosensis]
MEREAELAVLSSLLSASLKGRGRVAVITGPTGYGKTTLLRTFADHAEKQGAVFISATAARTENGVPELFGQLARHPRLPAASGPPVQLPADGDPALSSSALHRMWKPVHELAAEAPVVIGVDDVHHADEAVLRSLLHLTRRLETSPIVVVLTLSSCSLDERASFTAELRSQPHCRHIRLRPLAAPAVAGIVTRGLGSAVPDDCLEAFHRLSGGNPLLLDALVADTRAARPARPHAVAGNDYVQAVWQCLHRAHPAVVDCARAVAVLGGDASPAPALLGRILDADPADIALALQSLETIGLLEDGGFRDEAAREALYAKVPARERAAMHLHAACALREDGEPAARVARPLAEAGTVGAGWMIDVLRQAADHEQHDGDFTSAIRYLRLARQAASAHGGDEAQLTAELASAEWQVDPLQVVRLLPELRAAAAAGRLTDRQTEDLVTYLLWHGRREQARALLTGGTDRLPATGWASRFRSWLYPTLLADLGGAPPDDRSVEVAVITGGEMDDDLLIAAEQVLLSTRLDDSVLVPALTALAVLVYTEGLDRAAAWIDILLKAAERRGSLTWQALLSTTSSIIDVRRGDLRTAEGHAQRSLTLLSNRSWGMALGLPLSSSIQIATACGRYDEAAKFLRVPLPDGMFETLPGLYYMFARGHYHAAIGQHLTALADFGSCGDLMRGWGNDQPALVPWRGEAARACLRLGRTDRARALVEEQMARTMSWDARTRGASLRVLAELAAPDERAVLLAEAVSALEGTTDRVGLATALTELSLARTALRDEDGARDAARSARPLIKKCGLEPLAAALPGGGPDRDGGDKPLRIAGPTAELSDAEQRVASLAAAGFSNRQIASELFITVSTVEQHLTRVYRKLNVSRRPNLAKALGTPA